MAIGQDIEAGHTSPAHVLDASEGKSGPFGQSSVIFEPAAAGNEKDGVLINQKDEPFQEMGKAFPDLAQLTADASTAAAQERKMSLLEGLRLYPTAVFFSVALSLAVIMEGYDTALLNNFFGMPSFARKFGQYTILDSNGNPSYQLSAAWQNALGNGTSAAQIIGLFINGIISERFGYRWTMIGALFAITCFIFMQFFAVNIQMLLAAYVLCGLPWGIFQTLTTTYAAEICPVPLRPYLTTHVNICWTVGQLIASGVLRGFVSGTSEWSYRIPYAIQWIWPPAIALAAFFAPESPWWLVRHNKIDEARTALLRLTSRRANLDFNVDQTLAMMVHQNEMEILQSSGTSYWDCFKGVNLRRTELAVVVWIIQHTCGTPMNGAGTYFMEQAGLSASNAFSLGIGQAAMGVVGCIVTWFWLPFFGRRALYLWGQIGMFIILLAIGGLGVPSISPGVGWASGSLILVSSFIYGCTLGPVCYSLVAELPSSRLRIKTVVLARNAYLMSGLVTSTLEAHFINPTAWNWRGKAAFFWAGTNLVGLIWSYFRLPEPKGLTYADLDVLFQNRVPARKFNKVTVDPYRSEHLVAVSDELETNDK